MIGGLGTAIGPILGAVFIVWSPVYTQILFNAKPDIAFGVLLILVMYTMPSGIAGGVYRLWAWYQRRRAAGRPKSGEDGTMLVGKAASPRGVSGPGL